MAGNINNFGDFALAAGIGALSGAAGFGAGQLMAGAVGTIGFAGGALTGAVSGFAGGFVGGAGNAWAGGASFTGGLRAGLTSGGYGALTRGLIGGVSGGLQAARYNGNFWSGKGATFEYIDTGGAIEQGGKSLKDKYNDKFLNKFADIQLDRPDALNSLKASTPKGYTNNGDYFARSGNSKVFGVTRKSGIFNKWDVHISKEAFRSAKQLYVTIGHEYIHVSHYGSGLTNVNHSEYEAHSWGLLQRQEFGLIAPHKINIIETLRRANPNWASHSDYDFQKFAPAFIRKLKPF